MSYEIVKMCKHLPNGDFDLLTASNNVHPRYWNRWTMTYYREQFPEYTAAQREAAFAISGADSGTVHYNTRFKKLVQAANEYRETLPEGDLRGEFTFHFAPVDEEPKWIEGKEWCVKNNRPLPKCFEFETYDKYVQWRKSINLQLVDGFIRYCANRNTIKAKIRLEYIGSVYWVSKVTRGSMMYNPFEKSAKVFEDTREAISKVLARIPTFYNPKIVEVA